jgi:hypothetical protein
LSEEILPEAAAPAETADNSSQTISGLGAKGPSGREALSQMRDQMIGDAVVDPVKSANVESNREAELGQRVNMKDVEGTVTYGKGIPHVTR